MELTIRILLCLFALQSTSGLTAAQNFQSLEQTLKLARERGLRAAQVDWDHIETKARLKAKDQSEDVAIRFVLQSLGDGHSFYRPLKKTSTVPLVTNSLAKRRLREIAEVQSPVLGVPVIRINSWSGTNQQAKAAANMLRTELLSVLAVPRCGIILDFSGNAGGNMWPMLVGLSPLLSDGALGYFKDASGSTKAIEKQSGRILFAGVAHLLNDASPLQPKYAAARIAVVVGPQTSSSGEIVPIMFHGQENVRIFGQKTAGYATVNSTFQLPNGGAAMITTAVTLDRQHKEFATHIEPETITSRPFEAAARWISNQCQTGQLDKLPTLAPVRGGI